MRLAASFAAAALALSAPAAAQQSAERPPVQPIRASKIVLVGDSTVAVQGGWGPSFCARHVTSFLACVNLARGGRSSYNYRAEGSWDIALAEMRRRPWEQVYVLIQFGHNDQPGKPGRSTELATEFPANLKRYVAEARAAGAIPVLVTPLTRRQFKDGTLIRDLEPWAEATRRVAAETGAPLVDLHARSTAAVQAMGAAAATRFAQRPPSPTVWAAAATGTTIDANGGAVPAPAAANAAAEPMGQAKLSFDYTHIGPEGADFFAGQVVEELARAVPALRRNLIP
ncbi:rhamnogalacturonan acetylesterase [Sphingomonas parva]|uniref:Rhamnogalacturonan acetylesterase n=1 Tax=Sphingomonas parva TaxID=2555898 RepID=A0A4Y8ZNI4_9SPHN|nr:rhamnogalacturonan acetylesterase [Sphingomonas parva]TFI57568.1 rhamnogalacturonan acetylesterase [Sphingomonas parva]